MGGKKKTTRENDGFYSIKTIDNVTLWIKRYKPEKGNIATTPVILCHGLLANKYSLDFGDKDQENDYWNKYSLAAYLYHEQNDHDLRFDVWVPELRGRRSYSEYDFAKRGQVPESMHWCFDDYVDKDVPAIIECVKKTYEKEKKGVPEVFWVGMSMGGILAYAHGQTDGGRRDFKGVVTIGSPAVFEHSKSTFAKFKGLAPRHVFFRINLRSFLENNPLLKEMFVKNAKKTDQISDELIEKYLEMGFDNSISSKIVSHFGLFFRHQDLCRYPKCPWFYDLMSHIPLLRKCVKPFSWKDHLHLFQTPLLAIAGGADEEAPPQEVKKVISKLGSTDIIYLEFSEESTIGKNYSHLDFHLGKNVREDVYKKISKWLIRKEQDQK